MKEIETKHSGFKKDVEKLTAELAKIRKEVDMQKTRERDLEDNVRSALNKLLLV